ncbi:cation-translocating P-type ATPase [Haloterrigena sp. SYSU A121-1]|uniref:Cation-translocating P-type ATPase n=1 Tax=Haloterrigena gelatinilytica TaxID=2741724 RepID=A0A8J8GJW8_9EURY|nr:heavy metal translocating P-type ATPase [Haloterrigena gelatinilytica]NUB89677.1 cation-translocating P-type ATPase [Haloterrigena gelatinilytica]
MSETRTDRERCRLCGTALEESPGEPVADAGADGPFCSTGCRDIAADLGVGEDGADGTVDADETPDDDRPADLERSFFRIDGMHSAQCESYLESVAEGRDGVADAAASYVTETVRVDHDPDRIAAETLEDALSTTGYTAYRREEAAEDDDAASDESATRRSREMQGVRKRRSENVLEVRYIVGIVFGSFLLVPYVTTFYPMYLAAFTDYWLFEQFAQQFDSYEVSLYAPLFMGMTGAILYLTGRPLLRGAYVSLKLREPSTHLLATLTIVAAYAAGAVAFVRGGPDLYFDLTILVAAIVMGAIFYEETVKRDALNRLTDLTISQVGTARVLESDGATREVPVADVAADDRLLVRAGERIPVDGRLAEGPCTVDEAVVTGESLPVSKADGDPVIGGSVVTDGAAVVAVDDETTSSIDRLTRTVWNLQSADHGVQRRADALAGTALPIVVAAAVVAGLAALVLDGTAVGVAAAVCLALIAASPWAFAFATPISIASSIRDALERGIVVFDESVFERLREIDVVVFDKTGTLTTGEMTVLEADAPEDLLRAAAAVERRASHPAAAAIANAFGDSTDAASDARADGGVVDDAEDAAGGEGAEPGTVREFERHATGVGGVVDGRRILAGHPDLFRERGWDLEDGLTDRIAEAREAGHLPVVVGRDGRAEGVIVVGDEPREGWAETVTALADEGVDVVVLTGDDGSAAAAFREHSGVTRVFANVPPAGKTAAIRRLRAEGRVAMVGDGTNDAPALAAADLGLSLGGGTALAADAADLAIVEDDLAAVERAFALARAARRRVVRNLGLALGYNAIVIPVALAGLLNPVVTTGALAVTGLAITGNSLRELVGDE